MAVLATALFEDRDCQHATPAQRKKWGCGGGLKPPLVLDGVVFDHCPKRDYCQNMAYYEFVFGRFVDYKRGMLPDDGGLMSQPAKLMECFEVIKGAVADIEADKRRREAQKAKQK